MQFENAPDQTRTNLKDKCNLKSGKRINKNVVFIYVLMHITRIEI